ncbi:MAG TPA: hypothetical protein VJH96_04355 [Patescibacteria group bacterium]|nr:hypothetical protein [Patescibacteria group bacterium]
MHIYFVRLFLYILSIFLTGGILYLAFFPGVVRKNNIFIGLGISWILGIFSFIIILYVLAFINALHYVTFAYFIPFFSAVVLIFVYMLYKRWREFVPMVTIKDGIALLVTCVFFYSLLQDALFSYLIAWDGIAIWFLKAKSFFYNAGVWNNAFFENLFTYQYVHKAYPIGFPLLIAAYYRLIGTVNDQVVQFFLLFFYLNLFLISYGFLKTALKTVSSIILFFASLAIFIVPQFIIYSHNGYADMALSFIFALSTILFIFFLQDKAERPAYMKLLFITSASGAFIKNEGYTFFASMAFFTILIFIRDHFREKAQHKTIRMTRVISLLILGALILFPLFLWQYFKQTVPIEANSYLEGAHLYANSLSRLSMIIFHYLDEVTNVTKYGIFSILVLFLFIFEHVVFIANGKIKQLLPSLPFLVQLFFYTVIYLVTTVLLEWQLRTSFERLWIHLFPSVIIVSACYIIPTISLIEKTWHISLGRAK